MNYYSIKKEKLSPKEVALQQRQSRKLLWEGFKLHDEARDERDTIKNLFVTSVGRNRNFYSHDAQIDVFSNDTGTHLIRIF
jgi:hypothetical protein